MPSFWGLNPQTPKPPAAGDSAPDPPPSMMRLNYTNLLAHVSQFENFYFLTLVNHITASGLPFYDIFAHKKFLVRKFLITSLHAIFDLYLPNQKSWLRLCFESCSWKAFQHGQRHFETQTFWSQRWAFCEAWFLERQLNKVHQCVTLCIFVITIATIAISSLCRGTTWKLENE